MKSNLTSINEIHTLRRWVRIACEAANLGVEWTDKPMPFTTKKSIHIPKFNNNMTVDDVKRIRFYTLHECSHHNDGSAEYFNVMEKHGLRVQHPLGAISNILEDQRIERRAAAKYEGDASTISEGRQLLFRDSMKYWSKIAKSVAPDQLDDDAARMQAVSGAASVSQAGWCAGISSLTRKEMDLCCGTFPNIKQAFEKLIGADVISKTNSLRKPEESYELAREIYKLLWDKTDEEVDQELEQIRQASEQSPNGEGEAQGSGKGQGGGDEGDGDSEGHINQVDPRSGKYKIPVEFFVKSDHGQFKDGDHGHGLGLDYTRYKKRAAYVPEDFQNMKVKEFNGTSKVSGKGNIDEWANVGGNDMTTSPSFANRVRTFLQVNTEDGYIGGMKRGAVNTRVLYRAGLPQVGDGDWNKKVFRVRDENEMLDTSVSLVVDMSGSMSGEKIVHATRAAMALNNVISNVLRVNTEILTFSWMNFSSLIGVIKKFGERVPDDAVLARFNKMSDKMWGNNDADAIAFAHHRIMQQDTKRKVMIVLSDGSPADGIEYTDPYHALKHVVKEIEDSKKCDIIGIGIMDDSVNHFYKRRVVIKNANLLEEKLLEVITGNIIGG